MPNRIIRDSVRTSYSLSWLTAEEERHFYRLLVYADDYGRFDARPEIIRGMCYPLLLERVSAADVRNWTQRLADDVVGILSLYTVDERQYGVFSNWAKYQRIRNAKSKYPDPPSIDSNMPQTAAFAPVVVNEIEDVVEDDISQGDESPWLPPDFFKPLTQLVGYEAKNYSVTATKFQTQCREAGVNPSDAIERFAQFYSTERVRYGWVDPVIACRRNLGKSIGQILRGINPNNQHPKDNFEKLKELERGASRGRPVQSV